MNKEIKKLENSFKAMKKCLKIPNVENCVCFSDAFKVLDIETNKLRKKTDQLSGQNKEKLVSIEDEIEKIKKIVSHGNKECIGCSPCIASIVFKAYPDTLNRLYINNNL